MSHSIGGVTAGTNREATPADFRAFTPPAPDLSPAHAPRFDAEQVATRLFRAMHGGYLDFGAFHIGSVALGVNKDEVFAALHGLSKAEVTAVSGEYLAHYGRDLRDDLGSELGVSNVQLDELMQGQGPSGSLPPPSQPVTAQAAAQGILQALDRVLLGPDVHAVVRLLEPFDREGMAALDAAFTQIADSPLKAVLETLPEGPLRDQALALHDGDSARAHAAALRGMVAGLFGSIGTSKTPISELEGLSLERIDSIRAAYQELYQRPLDDDLRDRLAGADEFYALMHLRGAPTGSDVTGRLEAAVARLEEIHEFERPMGIGERLGDLLNAHGKTLDGHVDEVRQLLASAKTDGEIQPHEEEAIVRHLQYAHADVDTHARARDELAGHVCNVAGLMTAVATAAVTAPALPVLGAALVSVGMAGSLRGLAGAAIRGPHNSNEAMVSEWRWGALDGGAVGVASRLTLQLTKSIPGIARQGGVVLHATTGALDGAAGSAASGLVETGVDPDTWGAGLARGVMQVAGSTVAGAAVGAALGGLTGGGAGLLLGSAQRFWRDELLATIEDRAVRRAVSGVSSEEFAATFGPGPYAEYERALLHVPRFVSLMQEDPSHARAMAQLGGDIAGWIAVHGFDPVKEAAGLYARSPTLLRDLEAAYGGFPELLRKLHTDRSGVHALASQYLDTRRLLEEYRDKHPLPFSELFVGRSFREAHDLTQATRQAIEGLKSTNPRAYETLSGTSVLNVHVALGAGPYDDRVLQLLELEGFVRLLSGGGAMSENARRMVDLQQMGFLDLVAVANRSDLGFDVAWRAANLYSRYPEQFVELAAASAGFEAVLPSLKGLHDYGSILTDMQARKKARE